MSDSRSDDNFEDIPQILAVANNSQLCDPCSIDPMQDINDGSRPPALLASSDLNLMPDFAQGLDCSGTVTHNEESYSQNAAPQQLLEREFTDQDALLEIFPSAEIKHNCIGAFDYILVVRKLLFNWKISNCFENNWLSSGVLSYPHAYARIFRRLGGELKLMYSEDGSDSTNLLNHRKLYKCLGELESDMFKAVTVLGSKDGEVNIFRETEPYEDCLRSIAKVLENCEGVLLYLSLAKMGCLKKLNLHFCFFLPQGVMLSLLNLLVVQIEVLVRMVDTYLLESSRYLRK